MFEEYLYLSIGMAIVSTIFLYAIILKILLYLLAGEIDGVD